jgi:hypothetical protein
MISICIAGCLRRPERVPYLRQNMDSLLKHFPEADYLIGLDNTSEEAGNLVQKEYPMARVKVHSLGFGHSWNWAIKEAKHDFILQTEEDWLCTCCWSSDKDKDIAQKVEYGIEKCTSDTGILLKLDNGMGIGSPPTSPYRPGWKEYEKCPKTGKQVYELNRPDPRHWYEGWNPYFMSNHPHLKHKKFHELVGFYAEKAALLAMIKQHIRDEKKADLAVVPQTELDMCKKVIINPKTKMLFYNNNSFVHIGHESVREY